MNDRTLEQIEADYKLMVYGSCEFCKKPFEYGEESLKTCKVVKYSSHGQPDTYEKDKKEFHPGCFIEYMRNT